MNNTSYNVKTVLRCEGLAKTFDEGGLNVAVLHDINLTVVPGEQIGIMGSSGSGKSTLLHLLGGLDIPTSGSVYIMDQDIAKIGEAERGRMRNQILGFVYQFHHLLPEFTALENVCMPLLIRAMAPQEAREKASSILQRVGLASRLHHKPSELSGGERQRTATARALVTNPRCVLADEPTGNLDRRTAESVYNLMLELHQEFNTSFVVATHDPNLAARMERVLTLEDGKLIEQTREEG